MSDLTLKPCPFCGGEARLVKDFCSFKDWNYVRCEECGAMTSTADNAYRAINYWNQRAEIDRVFEELETVLYRRVHPTRNESGEIVPEYDDSLHVRLEDYHTIRKKYINE